MEHGRRAGTVLSGIRFVRETGSTNADMADWARAGVGEGVWLRAGRQTAARGRLSRPWRAPDGNYSGSTLVRRHAGDPEAATLALVAAVALHEAVSVHMASAPDHVLTLKWPNDLLLDGAKLSGILLERVDDAVVVGIGVNLAYEAGLVERATASLTGAGSAVTAEVFATTLADVFARWLSRWRSEGTAPVRAAWLAAAHPAGTALTIRLPDGEAVEGLFAGLDADGALMLRLAAGGTRVIHAGDVSLLMEP